MIILPMLCLVLKFGKTDFFRMTIEKVSWKRKGNCPSYSWTDPMSDGFDTSYISRTCTLYHETLESFLLKENGTYHNKSSFGRN